MIAPNNETDGHTGCEDCPACRLTRQVSQAVLGAARGLTFDYIENTAGGAVESSGTEYGFSAIESTAEGLISALAEFVSDHRGDRNFESVRADITRAIG